MTPAHFKESTSVLTAGDNPNCGDLDVFKGDGLIISKWRMSWRERVKALFVGTVWFSIRGAVTHPPISMGVDYPFED